MDSQNFIGPQQKKHPSIPAQGECILHTTPLLPITLLPNNQLGTTKKQKDELTALQNKKAASSPLQMQGRTISRL